MKTKNHRISASALFWALLFIGIAVVLLLDALQLTDTLLPAGLSIWRILLGGVFLWWLIHGLRKRSPFAIIFPLFGELMLFDRWLLRAVDSSRVQIAPVWLMLLIALLLSIGFSILKHTLRPGHSNFTHADGEQIAEFVNSFNTAAELSEFSHHLRYWSENGCGQLIRYGEYDREVSDAIAARMRTIAGEES